MSIRFSSGVSKLLISTERPILPFVLVERDDSCVDFFPFLVRSSGWTGLEVGSLVGGKASFNPTVGIIPKE